MRRFILALQFLTILPVKISGPVGDREVSGSSAFFPAAGAFQGLIAIIIALLSGTIFPHEISAGLVLLAFIAINGGFHLDGLADTFDALAANSSGDPFSDRQRRLSIMKDSRTGAIGAIAIVMAILLKFLFLSHLFSSTIPRTLFGFIMLMPVFSKWAMVIAMYLGIPARREGLGKIFIADMQPSSFIIASVSVVFFLISAGLLFFTDEALRSVLFLFLIQSAFCVLFGFLSSNFCAKVFGGLTGDTLGALGEIEDIVFLMVIAIWLQLSI